MEARIKAVLERRFPEHEGCGIFRKFDEHSYLNPNMIITLMRPLITFFFLVLVLTASFAAGCEEGYVDEFTVKVLDANSQPVEDAAVEITYDRGTSFGDKYHTTDTRYTPANGKLDYRIAVPGTDVRDVECELVIRAFISGSEAEKTVEAKKHSSNIFLQLEVYPVDFRVKNQYGNPIANASVSVEGKTKTTDGAGRARYYLRPDTYDYLVSYLTGKQSGSITVTNEEDFDIVLEFNPVSIEVVDDRGEHLPSTVHIFNETFDVPDGRFDYPRAFGESINAIVEYNGSIKEVELFPGEDPDKRVVYDLRAPSFKNISTVTEGDLTRLLINVEDMGPYASGIDYQSLTVRYRTEEEGSPTPWSDATTFAASSDTFMADFPELPKNTVVRFRVEVADNDHNKASIEGRFTPESGDGPKENGGDEQENGEKEQDFPFIYICAGVILVLLILIVVNKLKGE
jgi:hypothetical protein